MFGRPNQVSNAGSLPDLNTKYAYDLIDVPECNGSIVLPCREATAAAKAAAAAMLEHYMPARQFAQDADSVTSVERSDGPGWKRPMPRVSSMLFDLEVRLLPSRHSMRVTVPGALCGSLALYSGRLLPSRSA